VSALLLSAVSGSGRQSGKAPVVIEKIARGGEGVEKVHWVSHMNGTIVR
jgi:hypothetical protein